MRISRWAVGASVGVVASAMAVAGFAGRSAASRSTAAHWSTDLFAQVFSLVRSSSVDSIGTDLLYEKAARGLVESIGDPYAELFTRDELASFSRESLGGAYGGLGMQIEDHAGRATISRVFPHGPAESGGLRPGDQIARIDSAAVRGWSLDRISKTLLGAPGTTVSVVIDRVGSAQPVHGRFTREIVHQPSVPFTVLLDRSVGYIPLRVFSPTAADEVQDALDRVLASGAASVILDVRDNGGGALDQALAIANDFLPEGTELASVRERSGDPEVYHASHRPITTTVPVVVLIDGGSASATEIVAGALQDHDRALVLGTTSFGKGLVQSVFPLDGGYALKLTTGRWFTPSGRTIQKPRRLTPDGRLVEIVADSTGADTTKKSRPVYHSDGGRVVYGGGAITPDVVVAADTLSTGDRALIAAVQPASQAAYLATYDVALGLRGSVAPGFVVEPAWRDTLYERWRAAKVPVDRAQFDAARTLVDRMLGDRIAELAMPDSTAFRRRVSDDRQLTRALELLRHARTQSDLLALAIAQRG
jgi:carboxyl-terminal processing protease